jgi:hypothetical protein
LRSRFWYTNLMMDEYMTRDAMAIGLVTLLMHVPGYIWGRFVNREVEILHSHINYQNEYGPRRNRLTHSLLFEEFEMQVEQWRKLE